uniref:Uncharacterized protein n=1 Tax=Arundo donax TaxID=35708 RepID=A0A0A9CKD8_ARUDO
MVVLTMRIPFGRDQSTFLYADVEMLTASNSVILGSGCQNRKWIINYGNLFFYLGNLIWHLERHTKMMGSFSAPLKLLN